MRKKAQVKFLHNQPSNFYGTLRARVDNYFKSNGKSQHGNFAMGLKSAILLSAYVVPFIVYIAFVPGPGISLLLWLLMGIAMAGVGMSVMHDANHGAYSANPAINNIMGWALNMVGGSIFNWKLQHNVLHHTYTNIEGMDEDIAAKAGLRFTEHSNLHARHKYQWLYAFPIYSITTLYWVVAKDFLQFRRYIRNGVIPAHKKGKGLILIRILLAKLVYVFAFLVLPGLISNAPFILTLSGFLLMHLTAGLILTVTFQLAHSVEDTSHPIPDANGIIENDWAIHQMNTTVNFCRKNKLISWYVGGLNFQVEHHLFPKISHIHYPRIAPIVKATAEEFGVPYLEQPNLTKAIRSHIRYLKTLGRLPNPDTLLG
ncbi:MAG TPA: acyl-CoA desaturase [Bacteroidia bacterium]|nr:acyl-CoA desaturase [Bacteroidia bacterium]